MEKLKFTGNWFIDAGIIGFINLMEEVYGWDINRLYQELINDEDKVYYGYFPIAYFYYYRKNSNCPSPPKQIIGKNKQQFLNFAFDYIEKNIVKDGVLEIKKENFYRNLLFFNRSLWDEATKKIIEGLISFDELVIKNYAYSNKKSKKYVMEREPYQYITLLDSTINKFLPSKNDFKNIYFTEFNIKNFRNTIPYLFVYLLCIPFSFTKIEGIGNIFFYVFDLETTYYINKRIKKFSESINNKEKQIFKKTLEEVIDEIIKNKCYWSLENLYYINYNKLDNQRFQNFEMVHFDKLRVSIIEDDFIRGKLSNSIEIGKNLKKKNLLNEFLLGKDLFGIYVKHLKYKKKQSYKEISYIISSICIVLNKTINKNNFLFEDHFVEYNKISKEIKDKYSLLQSYKKYFKNIPCKNAYPLLNSVIYNKKEHFLNLVLKEMLKKEIEGKDKIIEYLFKYILNNGENWKYYALPLVVELLTNK